MSMAPQNMQLGLISGENSEKTTPGLPVLLLLEDEDEDEKDEDHL